MEACFPVQRRKKRIVGPTASRTIQSARVAKKNLRAIFSGPKFSRIGSMLTPTAQPRANDGNAFIAQRNRSALLCSPGEMISRHLASPDLTG
jgi:hypothetical protein